MRALLDCGRTPAAALGSSNPPVYALASYAKALAAYGNAHSTIIDPRLRRVPLRFHWFADGLYVVKAAPAMETLLGARVLAIEGRDPEDVLTLLRPYIPGTEGWQRYRSEYF